MVIAFNHDTGEYEVYDEHSQPKTWYRFADCPASLASCKVPVVDDTQPFHLLVHQDSIDVNTKWKALSYAEWIRWHFDNPVGQTPKQDDAFGPYEDDPFNFVCFAYGVWPPGSRFKDMTLDAYYALRP